jgi:hypothetical protein
LRSKRMKRLRPSRSNNPSSNFSRCPSASRISSQDGIAKLQIAQIINSWGHIERVHPSIYQAGITE